MAVFYFILFLRVSGPSTIHGDRSARCPVTPRTQERWTATTSLVRRRRTAVVDASRARRPAAPVTDNRTAGVTCSRPWRPPIRRRPRAADGQRHQCRSRYRCHRRVASRTRPTSSTRSCPWWTRSSTISVRRRLRTRRPARPVRLSLRPGCRTSVRVCWSSRNSNWPSRTSRRTGRLRRLRPIPLWHRRRTAPSAVIRRAVSPPRPPRPPRRQRVRRPRRRAADRRKSDGQTKSLTTTKTTTTTKTYRPTAKEWVYIIYV